MRRLAELGGLAPSEFLQRHWQKRPLLVRAAIPGFRGPVDARTLAGLAARDEVESRLVVRRGRRRETVHGPFSGRIALGARDRTLLVSGLNLHVPAADRLLRRFAFVPQARLDDVMVSWATPGGGVGPHVDSYDVFLLQGPGRRRWRVWRGRRLWLDRVLGPGDLLYVPPGWRHDGTAIDECFTYSIGFRAPSGAELGAAFLDWLHERGLPQARYRDPGLAPAARPARLPQALVDFACAALARIRWTRRDVAAFLGEYLTSPKPHVVFRASRTRGPRLRLDEKTQLLYSGARFFINGEAFAPPRRARAALAELADRRSIEARRLAGESRLIGEWRRAGYVHLVADGAERDG